MKCVGAAAADWSGLMPPSPSAEDVDSGIGELSDSDKYCEFEVLTPLVSPIEKRYRWALPTSCGSGLYESHRFWIHPRAVHLLELDVNSVQRSDTQRFPGGRY